MGACDSATEYSQSPNISLALWDNLIKCPQAHWLAFYETAACSNCLSTGVCKSAKISCTEC